MMILLAQVMFLQPDILIENLARWKDMSAHVTVSEFLAKVCFISWLKTFIFSLPGRAVVAILTLLVHRLRVFPIF